MPFSKKLYSGTASPENGNLTKYQGKSPVCLPTREDHPRHHAHKHKQFAIVPQFAGLPHLLVAVYGKDDVCLDGTQNCFKSAVLL